MKQILLKGIISLFVLCISVSVYGQYFLWGQAPGSLKWNQIQTENFQVIFPQGYEERAAYVTAALELAYEYGSRTLSHRPRRVSVILHNQTVVSNGFVSWAPRRLEMFTNPPQNNDAHDWLEQLAIHEFRHVVQVDKLNQGISRVISWLLGEQGTGAVFGLFMPMWFVEGDAVAAETGLSNSGRGTLPVFEQGLRAQVIDKGVFSYDKAFFGSFKDYVPNYYELGYQLVASGRVKYGSEIWEKVVTNVARRPYTLRPFSRGLKKYAGVTSVQHYENTFKNLDSLWREQGEHYKVTPSILFTPKNNLYTNYRYPAFANDTTLVALKSSLDNIPQVVWFDRQANERVLFTPGLISPNNFSAGGGKVVWSETRTDPRWEHRSWSEVHVYNIESGQRTKLTHRSRYFAPAISPNGDLIAVAEVTDKNHYSLVIISAADGREISRMNNASNDFLMTPSWHPDNKTIVAVSLDQNGKSIVSGNIYSRNLLPVFHAGFVEISRPKFTSDGKILFTGAFSGIDKVYVLNTLDKSVNQLIASYFGASDAIIMPGTETVFWSEYTSGGYVIAQSKENVFEDVEPLALIHDHSPGFYKIIRQQEKGIISRPNIEKLQSERESEFDVLPYYKFPGIFNLHSWSPMFIDVFNQEVRPGAALYFQDLLSTSVAVVGYDFDMDEQLGAFSFDYNFYGFYPVINIRARSGLRKGTYRQNETEREFQYRESTLRFGANLPLRFRRYQWFYGITPFLNTSIIKVRSSARSPDFFKPNDLQSVDYRVYAYRQQRMVARDLRPRWAQVVDVNYRHSPFNGANMGNVFSARVVGFFPGLARHHSLRLAASWQEHKAGENLERTVNYRFPNLIAYPRGITGRRDLKAFVVSADYALPLFYPDLSLPPFLYLKRISTNLFADRAYTQTMVLPENGPAFKKNETLHSTGVEVSANMHLLRFISPLDLGLRFYYLPQTGKTGFTMLFGISF